MADMTTVLDELEASSVNTRTRINELLDAASTAAVYGRRASTTAALTWGYYGGRVGGTAVANGTVTLTDAATNYVVALISSGAVSVSTATTNWNDLAQYVRLYKITASGGAVTDYEDHRFGVGGSHAGGGSVAATPIDVQIACSDVTSPLAAANNVASFRAPVAMLLSEVRASLHTASSSGVVTVDINRNGTSILSTKLTIDASEETSTTAATPFAFVGGGDSIADDDKLTVDIDGAGTSASGLVVTLIGVRA